MEDNYRPVWWRPWLFTPPSPASAHVASDEGEAAVPEPAEFHLPRDVDAGAAAAAGDVDA
jgi:hypothetical protein